MAETISLGPKINLEDFMAVARFHAPVEFSPGYCERVNRSRALVEKWVEEEKVMYGVTTGFGALCTKAISREETARLRENIILSHSVSVGEPLPEEAVRGTLLMMLQNLGQGYSGVRLEVLEQIRQFLNRGLTPWAPGDGSVGYLSPEAHMALVITGRGKAWYQGKLLEGRDALAQAGLEPLTLASKEGLALVSGTTSPTALGAIGLYDLLQAARKTLEDARRTLEIEMNACCDNPILWPEPGNEDVISACNADSAYVGIAMDSSCMAATMMAKMSERRNNRLIDGNLSGYLWFLIQNPGLNSGVMIPQYTQAGLLNQMRILCTPAVIDNTPTCGNQEDYVAMGYNASLKSLKVAEKLEYILAIELLSVYEAQPFVDGSLRRSSASRQVLAEIAQTVPEMKEDMYLYPHIEFLKEKIHDGSILRWAEEGMGKKLV